MNYLAFDLGAESGRVMLGELGAGRLRLEELHRFSSAAVRVGGSLRVDLLRIFEELKAGMRRAASRGIAIAGVSTDSWGVDYVLLRRGQPFLAAPYHYRDGRVDPACERLFAKAGWEEVFAATGIQFMAINTLCQMEHDHEADPALFAAADGFLNIGDAVNALFSGVRRAEESLASTTQLYDPAARGWALGLIGKVGLPLSLFPEIVPPGTRLGPLEAGVAAETAVEGASVIASCSHDTGAAVAAVPAEGDDWAYLSSGTWSLLGVETAAPVVTEACRSMRFTNEAGYAGTTRLLKNLAGLWVLQECRRAWAAEGREYGYDELTRAAADARPLQSLLRLDAPCWGSPGGMPGRIEAYCRETGQPVPAGPGAFVRAILESLALLYKMTLAQVQSLSGREIARLHIVGGGSKNALLNQWSADATGLPVLAGPAEATAIGNVLIQAAALGEIEPRPEALRAVVRASFPPELFTPKTTPAWELAWARYRNLPH